MKLRPIMLVVAVVGLGLVLVAGVSPAATSPKQLLEEAKSLHAAHNYDAALKRLRQIKRDDLGFFEKGGFDSLLSKTQRAVTGKAVDEKAFADGKEALSKKQYATAVEKLSQAASSPYLEADKSGPAKGLLRLAQDGHDKALAQAKTLLAQAAADVKSGKTADARKKMDEVQALDVRLGGTERASLADLNKAMAAPQVKTAAKPQVKTAAKPAVEPAPKPEIKPAPKPPAGPSASDLYAAAKKQSTAGDYNAAQDQIAKIDRSQLGFFEKWGYDGFVKGVQKAIDERAAGEKALAQGQGALDKKQYAQAVKSLSAAASNDYLAADKRKAAEAAATLARNEQAKVLAAKTADEEKAKALVAKKAEDEQAKALAAKKVEDEQAKALAAKKAEDEKAKPEPAPKTPAGPTASDLYAAAKTQYDAGDYDAAQKELAKVDRSQLGFFEKWSYDALARNVPKAIAGRAAGEKALAAGNDALAKKRYTAALECLSEAASCDYLSADKIVAAKAAHQMAVAEHGQAVVGAKDRMAKARVAVGEGKAAEARKMVDEVKAMDIDLGWWAGRDLKGLDSRVTSVEASLVASAAKPAVEPTKVAVAPTTKTAAQPPAEPAKPAEEPKPAPVSVADQAKRAQAEEEMKLGDAALAKREYQKAKIRFAKAVDLWPASTRAKNGLDQAMTLLAEREEPLGDVVRDVRALERQRIIAGVQELVGRAEREMGRAERPEDYVEALRPLSQADRTIDVAPVLSVEELERLREEVYVLRKEILTRKAAAESVRGKKAVTEAEKREQERRVADRKDRENKVAQLWERATELRKGMQFGEAIEILDRLIAVDPNDERALRWREDLLYLEAQARQVDVRTRREDGFVEAITDSEEAAIHPGEKVRGETEYLRYPSAKHWKDLTDFRRSFTKAVSAEPKAVSETRRRLKEPIDLDFEKTSLDNVLKYISEVQRGLNIVIDPDVATAGIDLSTRVVDLKVKRVEVESVLGLILGADLGYKVESGYILVTTREKLQQNLPVVTYPVQDLVAQIPDFGGEAPRFEVGDVTQAAASAASGGGFGDLFGGGAATPADQAVGWQELVDIIQRTVNNQSDPSVAAWADEGGPAAIEFLNGLLIVTQTRVGHERVADLLDQLRRERAIMISVESRFCAVTDEFLQDITLDVDAAFLGSDRFGETNIPIYGADTQTIDQPVLLPDGTVAVGPSTWVDPAPGVPGGWFPGVPIYAPQNFGVPRAPKPIVVGSTGSNGMGTQTLLPLAGTTFAAFGQDEGGMVVSGTFLDKIQIGFLLRAIQADVRSTTLMAPRLTLYNGQRSYISIATVVTYLADVEPVVAEAAVGWDPTIGAIPVGTTLDVKATVSADRRYVQMDLRPQVADIEGWDEVIVEAAVPGLGIAQAPIQLPRVRVQDFKTTVSVPDGGTLLLGGTRQYIESEAETGVPILSKVPILKRLFNNRATVRRAYNLLILIRPKILIQAEEEHKLGYDDF